MENSDLTPQPLQPPPKPQPIYQPTGPWGFWLTLLLGIACFIIITVAQLIGVGIALAYLKFTGSEVNLAEIETNGMVLGIGGIVSLPAFVLPPILFARMRKTLSVSEYFHLRGASILSWVLWTVCGVGLFYLIGFLLQLLGAPEKDPWMIKIWESAGTNPAFLFTILIVAPIGEEWFFRGFLFKGWAEYKNSSGPWVAIILTTVIWTLIHGQYQWYGLVHLFFVGIYLGVARWKTGSIWVPIWIHFVNNLLATLTMHFTT